MKDIAWWCPELSDESVDLVNKVLASNYINDGEVTCAFETEIAALLKVPYVVAVTSGTAALYLALKALNIGPGDSVLVPNITFIATANAVSMTGAQPILVDVSPEFLTLDPQSVLSSLKSNTKAIIPVHLSGRAGTLDQILSIAEERGISVIEDAAQAFMSSHKGRLLGTYGKMGCFSFSPNKTITTGQGGAIVTKDYDLYVRLKELKDQGRPVQGSGHDDTHNSVGFNFKFTNIQAAVGLGQLKLLSQRLERMRSINSLYRNLLSVCPKVRLFNFNLGEGEVPQWTDLLAEDRPKLYEYLLRKQINCRNFWYPLNTQKPYFQPNENFPNSEKLYKELLWLPSSFLLTDQEVQYVASEIMQFYKSC